MEHIYGKLKDVGCISLASDVGCISLAPFSERVIRTTKVAQANFTALIFTSLLRLLREKTCLPRLLLPGHSVAGPGP